MSRGRFHLTFPEQLLHEPVIYRVGKDFDVVTNIRRANVEEHRAWLIVEMDGDDDAVQNAVRWLAEQDVQIERIADDEVPSAADGGPKEAS